MLIATTVNFESSWNTLFTKIGALPPTLVSWLGIIGAVMVAFAVGRYLLDRRKGQRGNHMTLIFTAVVGVVLFAPQVIIGHLLGVVDFAANLVLKAFGA